MLKLGALVIFHEIFFASYVFFLFIFGLLWFPLWSRLCGGHIRVTTYVQVDYGGWMTRMISLSNSFELMFIPTYLAHLLTLIFCMDHNMIFGWKICGHPFGIRFWGRMFDIGGWNVVIECWGRCPLACPTMMLMVGLV